MQVKQTSPIADCWTVSQDGCAAPGVHAGATLVGLYERITATQPERTAVISGGGTERLTYAELNERANRLARHLRGKVGTTPATDSLIAIYLDRSPQMLVAMLAVLKAGLAYLPIDATYPPARVVTMLEDARPVAMVTTSHLVAEVADELAKLPMATLCVDTACAAIEAERNENLDVEVKADDLAYVMYTSGSTGKPKGVMVTHCNVVRLLQQTDAWFGFGPEDVWTLFHSMAFDFSVWEIWGCLLTGGRLVLVSYEVSRSPREFHALLITERVTVLNQTPSAFLMLAAVDEDFAVKLAGLRVVIFGGEALQYRALAPWFRRYGNSGPQLVNMYGITETTVHVTYRVVTETDAATEQESLIGVPIPDLQLYLLDADQRQVAQGEVGELYVGGAGVARGYLNRPELNAERFMDDPFRAGGRLYRTGDLGRFRADGELVYLGRNDRQVKINGFRIELGEVEAAIAACPGVRQSCVTAHRSDDGSQRLAAYFVTTAGSPSTGTLSHFLVTRLPAHMRPSFYAGMERLPLNSNGKVDMAALPKPGAERSGQHAIAAAAPANDMEVRITRIVCKMLGVANAGPEENFFDIGGTSLQLIRTHDEVESELGRSFSITWMFEYPTVRSLAKQLASDGPATAVDNRIQTQAGRQRGIFARASSARRRSH